MSFRYKGDRFYCNFCERSFSKMLSRSGRPSAECPYCASLERTRLLLHYLNDQTDIFNKHISVLHFAPAVCLFDKLVNLDIEYIDADYNIANARYKEDITDISYADDYFDLIICSHVLGHVGDEAMAMREMKRVLKPSGKAIIITYIVLEATQTRDDPNINTAKLRKEHYGELDCLRLHGMNFDKLLEAQGFDVELINYRDSMDPEVVLKESLGVCGKEWIYLCK